MRVNIEQQTYVFIVSVFGGIALSIVYDILKAIKRLIKASKVIASIFDIIFWVIAAGVMFYLLNMSNGGQIRGFCILGFVIGGFLYYLIVGNKLVNTICFIIEKICLILLCIFKIIIKPILFLLKILKFIFSPLLKLMASILYNIKSRCKVSCKCFTRDVRKSLRIIRKKK